MGYITLLIVKPIQKILKMRGRGTATPGYLALKLNKNIFKHFKLPKITICVTGTTGKTTISGTLANMYQNAGYKVSHNVKGSNLIDGALSTLIDSSKISGKSKVDVLIIEIDERYVKNLFKEIHPNYFIISNLSRDQLARNGHFDIVFDEINKSITKDIHLVLNVDDPVVNKFSIDHKGKITYYGLAKNKLSTNVGPNNLDLAYCPKCNQKLEFSYFHYGNLGDYKCPRGDFERTKPDFEAKLIDDKTFKINKDIINLPNDALYNVYNLTACYALGTLTGIESSKIIDTFDNLSLKVKRVSTFKLDKLEGTFLLSKNETPMSYNQSLDYIKKQKENKTVVLGFTRISGRYNLKDLSWLYDINFEILNNDSVKRIICIGPFSNDLIVRLKLAGVDTKKIVTGFDPEKMLETIKDKKIGYVYCMLYFDAEKILKKQLTKEGASL